MRSAPRLRTLLLLRLLPVLLAAMLVSGALSYFGAKYYVNQAFDRVLVDTLNGISSRILIKDGRLIFDFPEAAQKIFEWDIDDAAYFRIESRKTGHIAGQTDLELTLPPITAQAKTTSVRDSAYRQRPIRVAMTTVTPPGVDDQIRVVVAETTISRDIMTREIALTVLIAQLVLIGLAILVVWVTMRRAIEPISEAARDLEQRTHHSQEPLDDTQIPEEIRPLTSALNALLERLHQALALQRQFVADAAHQLRTPLTALRLHLENAQIAKDKADIQPMLTQVQIAADRAIRVAQQLLTLAESEERLLRGDRDTFNLSALLNEMKDLWAPQAAKHSIQIALGQPDTTATASHEIWLSSNRDLIVQVLDNLIDNALRYCPSGSTILIWAGRDTESGVQIVVEDDGPGIPESERALVIRRFYRGDQSPKPSQQSQGPGSGLGLAIAHEIMIRLGGTLKIATPSNHRGLSVRLLFPEHQLSTAA